MSRRKKQPSGNPARHGLSSRARVVVRQFDQWAADAEATFVDAGIAGRELERLAVWTSRVGMDVFAAEDAVDLVDLLLDAESGEDDLLDVFHDYVHFRLETDPGDDWLEAHELLEELLDDVGELPAILTDAVEEWAERDPEQRRKALAGVRIIEQVAPLLAWLGKGRAITDSGALRRADIADAAALLGITARGVATLPSNGEYLDGAVIVDDEALVTSMSDLPPLAAWWEATRAADLITLTASRVRPGPAASRWGDEPDPPLEDAAMLVSVYVAHALTAAQATAPDTWTGALLRLTLVQAIDVLEPGAVDASPNALDDILLLRARRPLAYLADAGILNRTADDTFTVPELLRGPFAQGITLAMAFMSGSMDDAAEDEGASPFDDPEVRAEMARLGIVHTPGMAAEMMRELAPLLAEEGFDLDNLDADVDLDAVNAALARATERRNLELLTPVGEQRAMTLTVHRLVAEALAEGSIDLARVVMDGIKPDPVGAMPSAAQVIGVGLGMLDHWHRNPASAEALKKAAVPTWDAGAMRAARDILRAARDGAAFDQLATLHRRHHGKLVMEGTLLAVAACVAAVALDDGASARDTASHLLV